MIEDKFGYNKHQIVRASDLEQREIVDSEGRRIKQKSVKFAVGTYFKE